MAFTAAELSNIANSALDFYVKGDAFANNIQNKPLLNAMIAKQKTFPGGKGNISIPVKGDYTTAIAGYTHNDTVSYANPANIKRATFPWKEVHAGIAVTLSELKVDGISVADSTTGSKTVEHSDRELTAITNLLQDKLDDMGEGWARSFNKMLWQDGTQDAKQVPGILSLITDSPTTGVIGGIDRSVATWWQNRAKVSANAIIPATSSQTLTRTLRQEFRQLTRYGGKPTLVVCGSRFLNALEDEIQSKGYYTQQGFRKNGATEIGLPSITMVGVGDFIYDPTLDDLGDTYARRAYFIDENAIQLHVMEGEDRKTHNPARPYNQYVLYRAMTWTGGLAARQFNSSGVYEIQSAAANTNGY
jgi:hypothetical protein